MGRPEKVKEISRTDAIEQVRKHCGSVERNFANPLYSKAIVPVRRFQWLSSVKGALADFSGKLKAMDEADGRWNEALNDNMQIKQKRNAARDTSRVPRNEGRRANGFSASRESSTHQQKLEEDVLASERILIEAVGRSKQQTDEYKASLDNLSWILRSAIADAEIDFGFVNYTGLSKKQREMNRKFRRFCEDIQKYLGLRFEDQGDIEAVLSLVERACGALQDWAKIYDLDEIEGLKTEHRACWDRWLGKDGKLPGDNFDRDERVPRHIVDGAKKDWTRIRDKAEKLNKEGKARKKQSDAETRLNEMMKEMHSLLKSSQGIAKKNRILSRIHRTKSRSGASKSKRMG